MGSVSRFTVSVPTELLEAVDRRLVTDAETRSALVRRLPQEAVREAQEQDDIQRYVESYRREPQTEEELGWLDQAAVDLLVASEEL